MRRGPQRLTQETDVPADSIDVKVKDGWVTLKAQVKHQFQSDAALEDVASTKGVGGITNERRDSPRVDSQSPPLVYP